MSAPARPRAARSSLERFVEALSRAGVWHSLRGDHVSFRCPLPSHEDRHASAAADWHPPAGTKSGTVLLKCHTCGESVNDQIISVLGLTWDDLYDEPATPKHDTNRAGRTAGATRRARPSRAAKSAPVSGAAKSKDKAAAPPKLTWKLAAVYPYLDEAGELVAEKHRKESTEVDPATGKRRKRMLWRCPRPKGGWLPKLTDDARAGLPLYRLPALLAAKAETPHPIVWLTEGEKNADDLAEAGHLAVSGPHGGDIKHWKPNYTTALSDTHLIIVVDRDDKGMAYGRALARALSEVTASLCMVRTPLPEDKADASDHLAAGLALSEFEVISVAGAHGAPAVPDGGVPIAEDPDARASAGTAQPDPDEPESELVPAELLDDDEGDLGRPRYSVNVTYHNAFRYSLDGQFGRALYERRRTEDGSDNYWRLRAQLPYVHARVIRRDGSRRRVGTEYLLSRTPESNRSLITDDALNDGSWAVQLGANLSGDHYIQTAAATAIRDIAHRGAPEREATPRAEVHSETGHLDIPVAEALPPGYLVGSPQVSEDEARDVWCGITGMVSTRPKIALTLGASAASPFGGPLRRQSHWWDLYGDARKGKSTTLALAAAIWGDPRLGSGITLGWNASSIGTGRWLGGLGVLPPFFDERGLTRFDSAQWGELIYSTCQGSSRLKAESDSPQGTHRGLPWFGTLFSTGNARLTDRITSGRFAGIPARVIELSTPLTESWSEAEDLEALAGAAYGWLGPALLRSCTVAVVREHLTRAEALVGVPAEGGVPGSIAKHLHLAVAGAMMIDHHLDTDTLLTDAAVLAAREHLEAHGHEPAHDADRLLDALAESLTARRSAWPTLEEYAELSRPRPGFGEDNFGRSELPQHGFDQHIRGIRTDDWLYVFPATWQALIDEHGLDSAVVCKKLDERALLHVAPARRKKGEWQASPRILGRPQRLYQVALSALPDDDETAPDDPPPPEPTPSEPTQPPLPTAEDPTLGPENQTLPPAAPSDDGPAEPTEPTESAGPISQPAPAQATTPPKGPNSPSAVPPASRSRLSTRPTGGWKEAQHHALTEAKHALVQGQPLRLLSALEGPYSPRRRDDSGTLRAPYWRPPLPGITFAAHVVSSWGWTRPYDGVVAVLDRSGAFVAAASSVEVAHGALQHTGPLEQFEGRPGYYLLDVHPWAEQDVLPHPLSGFGSRQEQVWVPAPTVALLRSLERQQRWPDVTVLDSYTAAPVRLRDWATFVNQLRASAIEEFGRDSDEYGAVKDAYGQALSLMLGSPAEHGTGREWRCRAQRPDWTHHIQAQASATLWRWADDCRNLAPDLAPVALRNVDELVIPHDALAIVTTTPRTGGRPPLQIDPDGLKLGSFKVKAHDSWQS